MMYGPHVCPVCPTSRYYGRYVHRGETEPATCPNHKEQVLLVPGKGAKKDPTRDE